MRVERPEMDGKPHRVPVEGGRGRGRSGAYKGQLDGRPAGFIENFRTGERLNWKASGQAVERSAENRERLAHDTAERQRERLLERERGYE